MEGESVTFENSLFFARRFSNDFASIDDYTGAQDWIFEGGSPGTSMEESVTVTYNTPGQYAVSLKLTDPAVSLLPSASIFVDKYVNVIAKDPITEAICFIESETSSNDRQTVFIFDDTNFLIRADKSLNGVVQEYSLYHYDASDRLEQEQFFDASDQLLGTTSYEYNAINQMILEATEDANSVLVRDRVFIWDDQEDFITSGIYREPDVGGLASFVVVINYDALKHNIISEIFTQNGVEVGRNNYEFDTHPKVFDGLNIESSPLKFNRNNATSIISLDANGTVVAQQTSTFEYGNTEESCGRPISEIRTTRNGSHFYLGVY